jgi:ABC-type protease/lipase transport system fused ATPase/permease subunit
VVLALLLPFLPLFFAMCFLAAACFLWVFVVVVEVLEVVVELDAAPCAKAIEPARAHAQISIRKRFILSP